MWCWTRMGKISWADRVRHEEILGSHRIKEMNTIHTIRVKKANRIGYILRRNWLLRHVIEGKIQGRIEMTGRRWRWRKQLLDDLKWNERVLEIGRSQSAENSLWKRLWTRGNTDYRMNEWWTATIFLKTRSSRSKLRISMNLCTLNDRCAALQPKYHAVFCVKQIGRPDCICLHWMSPYVKCTATALVDTNRTKASLPTHISIRIHILHQHEKSALFVYSTVTTSCEQLFLKGIIDLYRYNLSA